MKLIKLSDKDGIYAYNAEQILYICLHHTAPVIFVRITDRETAHRFTYTTRTDAEIAFQNLISDFNQTTK